jgi:hypothetical protein
MAVRGSIAKEEIAEKILETFTGSFKNNKELRIPWRENGEEIQIKITLTAAKDIVSSGGVAEAPVKETSIGDFPVVNAPERVVEATSAEKENVANLLKLLNL